MELTDPTLDHDIAIELRMPDAELFDHLGINQQDRYPSDEARKTFTGIDPSERDYGPDGDDFDEDDYRDPPMPDEYDKCDHCAAPNKGARGQTVKPRGTSLLTAPGQPEYLCPECFAQLASQYIGLDPYPALVAVLLSEHNPVWKIAQFHGKGIEGADEIESIAIDLFAEWKVAYDAADEVDVDVEFDAWEHQVEGEQLTEREHRFLELFPALGVGQPGVEFDGDRPDVSLTDVL